MYRPPRLTITWNDDIDAYMTKVESPDEILREFFKIKGWDFIRHIYHAVVEEEDIEFENKSIVFDDMVGLYVDNNVTQLDRYECMNIFFHLFELLIIGANDEHHGVRYEPWWQEFTESSYQLRCKIAVY